MIRDRQHGPVIELNRIQVKRSRSKGGLAGPEGTKSVFGQVCSKLSHFGSDSLLLPHRVWKVKFIGKELSAMPSNRMTMRNKEQGSYCFTI